MAASGARKLHLGHFAFMRAVVQGITPRVAWQRYMDHEGEGGDERVVRRTLRMLRDEFAAAARREHRFGAARLVLVDLSRVGADEPVLPGLAEFAAERGLDDIGEREQAAAFEAEFGRAAQRARRRERLVQRQLDALRWLEQRVAQPPRAGDAVEDWFDPLLAGKLKAADLFTLAQVLERINGVGRGWHGAIRGIGAGKAARIEGWLREHAGSAGMTIGAHVGQAHGGLFRDELQLVVAAATDVRPLEKLVVPAALDGRQGAFRRPQAHCLMAADNDRAALLAWLQSKHGLTPEQKRQAEAKRRTRSPTAVPASSVTGGDAGRVVPQAAVSPPAAAVVPASKPSTLPREAPLDGLDTLSHPLSHTQRAYRKEAERFLLWAIVERGKALSSMTPEDCIAYRDFLANPTPRSRWCAPRHHQRWSALWRPFEGPLSAMAQAQAITVLRNLYGFWAGRNYTMGNPWTSIRVPPSGQPAPVTGRSLTMAQWRFVRETSERRNGTPGASSTSSTKRLRFALSLLYATGLRLSEAVAARVDDLERVAYPADADDGEPLEGWLLNVAAARGRRRQVPLPLELVRELSAYLRSRGLAADPLCAANRGAHLLGRASDLTELVPQLHPGAADAKAGIAGNTLYDQLKRLFEECSLLLAKQGDATGAGRLAEASTHWLRHTHASHSIASGTRIEIAQQILGHASLATTALYANPEGKRRMRAMSAFWAESAKEA